MPGSFCSPLRPGGGSSATVSAALPTAPSERTTQRDVINFMKVPNSMKTIKGQFGEVVRERKTNNKPKNPIQKPSDQILHDPNGRSFEICSRNGHISLDGSLVSNMTMNFISCLSLFGPDIFK